ncbi:MAG: hypothetical protein J5933_06550 [Clostridia bacterium]|nr:hypothetical protein [Clostridia bacterium]
MYKYEMHLHSKDVSPCASADAEQLVAAFTERGYTGVNLTNHWNPGVLFRRNLLNMNRYELADYYMNGYWKLKEAAGDKLDVLNGMEIAVKGCYNDYLIYNVTREFLIELGSDFGYGSIEDIIRTAHDYECMIFHAHPYRHWMMIMPDSLFRKIGEPFDRNKFDGIESINYGSDDRFSNDMAMDWAEHYNVRTITGSDYHNKGGKPYGGILFREKPEGIDGFMKKLSEGDYALSYFGDMRWKIGEFHPGERFIEKSRYTPI